MLNALDKIALLLISFVTKSPQKQNVLHQFFKFGAIGVINTALDFGIYFFLTRYTDFFDVMTYKKYIANIISFFTAATFSLFANRLWTFARVDRIGLSEALKFYSTNVTAIILNSALLLAFIKLFALHDLVAKLLATVVTIFTNFFLQKFWVFKAQKKA
ncbi:MAG: GtrA family protein [bacterium]|nr:GtrA family protein [bacterium]